MNAAACQVFFQDLADLLGAGIPLGRALTTTGESTATPGLGLACERMGAALAQGASSGTVFDDAGIFPPEAGAIIAAGERAGELPRAMALLAEYFAMRAEMARRMQAALGYPLLVLGLLMAVSAYMVLAVGPRIADMFPAGTSGHEGAVLLAGIGDWVKRWRLPLAAAFAGGGAGLWLFARMYPECWKSGLRQLPLLGRAVHEQELALGFFAVHLFLNSNLPLDAALKEAAAVSGVRAWEGCAHALDSGLSLSEAMTGDRFFPKAAVAAIRIGEESGRFIEAMGRAQQLYCRSAQRRLEGLAGAVGPVLLLVAAGLITGLGVGVLRPLYAGLSSFGVLHP